MRHKAIDGRAMFTVTKPGRVGKRLVLAYAGASYRRSPEEMSDSRLREEMCDLGPDCCQGCMVCRYGEEYVRRQSGERS